MDELNSFFQNAGANVIFGLNALAGRTIQSGSAIGPWNFNAESFIRYTVRKNYSIAGWEFGNELCGSGVGTSVSANQYASDIAALRNIIHDVYRGIRHMPLVISPGGFYDANWFQEFVNKSGKSVDVVSHHTYNLGPVASTFSGLKNILQKSATKAKAWVGEAGGAYNSGHHLVSDAFVYSFWYLDSAWNVSCL
ncbi:heparanase-like protein 3 isoform X5 [Arachis hypogaea]|uniref:heparanase-like protein 3 isoform X5 n=1 Tax=Arachis hypogaea TaxID=3818 RepID=UPI003B221A84